MLAQIEGSKAMAKAIALCRPQVVCAYPITPQTHIVEGLGELVQRPERGKLRKQDHLRPGKPRHRDLDPVAHGLDVRMDRRDMHLDAGYGEGRHACDCSVSALFPK